MAQQIILDFKKFQLTAELFDTKIAKDFYNHLPYSIELTSWGHELYGSINLDLGKENPVPEIPAGGLAYTNDGEYLCIFFGQTPAWPVEYIGKIIDENWEAMLNQDIDQVTVTAKK